MSKISQVKWPKRPFNPTNKADLEEYDYFRKNNKWSSNCPFELEHPFLSVPHMINQKLVDTYFEIILDMSDE